MLVTRSIAPFLSMRRSAAPKCASCTRPARIAASIAVARKMGGTESGTAGSQFLDHAHFHAALGRPPERHVVHEAAHEEDAAAARFQQILGRERIGNLLGV